MSDETNQSGSTRPSSRRVLDWCTTWYPVPVVALIAAYMLWVRIQSRNNFLQGGQVYFSGNDAWYHYRQVMYTVKHWPATMPFDPWTGFPTGTSAAQFGTLFDQVVATVALVIGLGAPTDQTIGLTLAYAPAVFGALTVIPTYLIGKRLGGRVGGLLAAAVLALMPGLFLSRSLIGSADHNGAEPFFQGFAVVAMMIALAVADRERPVWEQVVDRDWTGLRSVIGWSVLAGVVTALYLWMWSPGIMVVGIFGAFFLVKQVADYLNESSPEHVAFVGAVSQGTTGLLLFLPFGSVDFGVTAYSFLQPVFAFAVAGGTIFLAWFARQWDSTEYDRYQYGLAVLGILLVGIAVVSVVLPSLYNTVTHNLLRFVGFSAGAATRTIGEAQPWMSRTVQLGLSEFWVIFMDYGMAFYTALVGALWLLIKPHVQSRRTNRIALVAAFLGVTIFVFIAPAVPAAIGGLFGIDGQLVSLSIVVIFLVSIIVTGEYESEKLLAVVWAAFITSAAFTQIRFNYYLAVSVAVFNAYLFGEFIAYFDFPSKSSVLEGVRSNDIADLWNRFDTSQVLVITLLVLIVLAPLAVGVSIPGGQSGQTFPTAQEAANGSSPSQFQKWEGSLEWMKSHTPTEGNWDDANNEFPYYGTYQQTADYDYPDGSYGVMSWWDYGHWITVEAERVPVANPFQQHATIAANYLLAPSEERANEILRQIDEDDAKTRYVMVDYQMVLPDSKFGAPIVFYDDGPEERPDFYKYMFAAQETPQGKQYRYFQTIKSQRYYESMMVRLYRYHGSAKAPQPVVVDWDQEQQTQYGPSLLSDSRNTSVRRFDNMSAARAFVEQDGTSQVGGLSNIPSEYVSALQHYRLVSVSEKQLVPANYIFNGELTNVPTYVKTFERVPGATVHGTAPANTTVSATVQMRIPAFNGSRLGSFEYTQRAQTGPDGEFTMVLPYSTTGYENWGPENGHTNVSVRAAGPYEITTGNMSSGEHGLTTIKYNTTAHVTEAQVIGEDDSTVTVELERRVVDEPDGANQTSTNQSSARMSTALTTDDDGQSESQASMAGSSPASLGPSIGVLGGFVVTARRSSA